MTIEEAIPKAMEGGYHINGADGVETYYSGASSEYSAWTRKDNSGADRNFKGTFSPAPLGATPQPRQRAIGCPVGGPDHTPDTSCARASPHPDAG